MNYENPFDFDAAANLPLSTLQDIFIEDHNCSRFIMSNRNIFLLGERGSGKSMMLIYHSFKRATLENKEGNNTDHYRYIGIHVPCKRALFNKPEYLLLQDKSQASMLSEHYLVLDILNSLAEELNSSREVVKQLDHSLLISDLEYLLGVELLKRPNALDSLQLFSKKTINDVETFPSKVSEIFEKFPLYSFQSLIVPVLDLLRSCELLKASHFMIMLDDAHDLNEHQIRKINSWISYRDHSLFSIKVATADVHRHNLETDFGGSIVDGHDYTSINMEKPFQNSSSPFYQLAKGIIERRLSLIGLQDVRAEDFFPVNEAMEKDLQNCKEIVTKRGKEKDLSRKQLSDYVYKNWRVEYFRSRADKANRPPYSGFETLVHSSTGVIRNLLSPCYEMYDQAYSETPTAISSIAPRYQEAVLMEISERLWTKLRTKKLSDQLSECTEEQALMVYNFFEVLGDLLTQRLKKHKSEPRVLTFTISGNSEEFRETIEEIFSIARKSLLLYERSGPAKDSGRRETFYVPNRMLWIARGLDPIGQHGRVSLPAKDIVAAFGGTAFPYSTENKPDAPQQELEF